MTTIFFLNNYKHGGAKIADRALENYFSSSNTINFHETIFTKRFFKHILSAHNIIIMNFFSPYTLVILLLLLFLIRKKTIYMSLKGQLMPHAIEKKRLKKSLFIFFMRLLCKPLQVKLIYTSMHEAIVSKSIGAKECVIIGDLLPEKYVNLVDDIEYKVQTINKYGYFGRIDPKKNIEFVFPILNSLDIRKFILWGSCQDHAHLEYIFRIANENNVEIDYRGNYTYNDFVEIRKSIDIFLMPTLAENFGYNILEAQLLGLQVFVSKGTTPWDCEFDDYNILGDTHFVELDQSAWIKKLRERRKNICINDGRRNLLTTLCRVREKQVRKFEEMLLR